MPTTRQKYLSHSDQRNNQKPLNQISVKEIEEAIKSTSIHQKSEALEGACNFLSTPITRQQTAWYITEIVPFCMKSLSYKTVDKTRDLHAIKIISSFIHWHHIGELVSKNKNIIEKLVDLIGFSNLEDTKSVLLVLKYIVSTNETLSAKLIELGTITKMYKLLEPFDCETDHDDLYEIVKSCTNLIRPTIEPLDQLRDFQEMLKVMVELLKNPNTNIVREICLYFTVITKRREFTEVIVGYNVVPVLFQYLLNTNIDVLIFALLRNVSSFAPEALLDPEFSTKLLQFWADSGERKTSITVDLFHIFDNSIAKCPTQVFDLFRYNGFDVLAQFFRSEDVEILTLCSYLITQMLTYCTKRNVSSMLKMPQLIKTFCDCLNVDHFELKNAVLKGLRELYRHATTEYEVNYINGILNNIGAIQKLKHLATDPDQLISSRAKVLLALNKA